MEVAATCTVPLGVDERRSEHAGVGSELGVSCTGYPSISRILACTALCPPQFTGLAIFLEPLSYAALLCAAPSQIYLQMVTLLAQEPTELCCNQSHHANHILSSDHRKDSHPFLERLAHACRSRRR